MSKTAFIHVTENRITNNGASYAVSYARDARTGSFGADFTLTLIAYMDSFVVISFIT